MDELVVPAVVLDEVDLSVEPGQECRLDVVVHNTGPNVADLVLKVVGPCASFAHCMPPTIPVMPGSEARAQVIFRPPHDATAPTGDLPFVVKATHRYTSGEEVSASAESLIHVAPIDDVSVRLVPSTSKGRWRGRHRVEIENRGSSAARVTVRTRDLSGGALAFAVNPKVVQVAAGGARAHATVTVRPRRPALMKEVETFPFEVSADRLLGSARPGLLRSTTVGGMSTSNVEGSFSRQPILGRRLLPVALMLLLPLAFLGWRLFSAADPEESNEPSANVGVPENVYAKESPGGVLVGWSPLSGATGFLVETYDAGSGATQEVAKVDRTSTAFEWDAEEGDLRRGTEYCLRVRAQKEDLTSAPSQPACVSYGAALPAPEILQAVQNGEEMAVAFLFKAPDSVSAAKFQVLWDGTAAETPCEEAACVLPVPPGRGAGEYNVKVRLVVRDGEPEQNASESVKVRLRAAPEPGGGSTGVVADPGAATLTAPFAILSLAAGDTSSLAPAKQAAIANGIAGPDGSAPMIVDQAALERNSIQGFPGAVVVGGFGGDQARAEAFCSDLRGRGGSCTKWPQS